MTLQELLRSTQSEWRLADAEVRSLQAASISTAEEVAKLRTELSRSAAAHGASTSRVEGDVGSLRSSLLNVQSE